MVDSNIKTPSHPKGVLLTNSNNKNNEATLIFTALKKASEILDNGMKIEIFKDAYDYDGSIIEGNSAIVAIGGKRDLSCLWELAQAQPEMIEANEIIDKELFG